MKPKKKDWKFYLGIGLFVWAWAGMIPMVGVTLLHIDPLVSLSLAAGIWVTTEIALFASIALLGKPFIQYMKEKFKSWFKKKKKK